MGHQIFKNLTFIKLLVIGLIFSINVFFTPFVSFAQSCDTFDPEDPEIVHIICPIIGLINVLVLSAGAVFVIFVILGSYKYATAQGDPKGAMGAQKTITYAVIGLIAIVGVYAMLRIIGNIFGFSESLTTGEGLVLRINTVMCAFLNNGGGGNEIVCTPACGCP